MKLLLLVVGKTVESWLKAGVDEYVSRLGHFAQFEMQVVPDQATT